MYGIFAAAHGIALTADTRIAIDADRFISLIIRAFHAFADVPAAIPPFYAPGVNHFRLGAGGIAICHAIEFTAELPVFAGIDADCFGTGITPLNIRRSAIVVALIVKCNRDAGFANARFTYARIASRTEITLFGYRRSTTAVNALVAFAMIDKALAAHADAAFAFLAFLILIAWDLAVFVVGCTFDLGRAFARHCCFAIDAVMTCAVFAKTIAAAAIFLEIAVIANQLGFLVSFA